MSKLTGVSTEIWGPKAWGFLHAVTFRYPEENASKQKRISAYQLLVSLERLLGYAEVCRAISRLVPRGDDEIHRGRLH